VCAATRRIKCTEGDHDMRCQRIVNGALALLAALAWGCGPKPSGGPAAAPPARDSGAGSAQASRRIVFVFKVDGLKYGEACQSGARRANDELASRGVSVEYLAPPKADNSGQVQIIEKLIADRVAAIVISPNDSKAIVPVIKQAMDAGIKVFTWDSDAPESQRVFYVAAADDVQIGVDIMDALARDMGGTGKVQIVSGGRGAENLNLHVKGFEEGAKKHPGIVLVKPYIYNDDDNVKARSMAIQALQKTPDLGGFACANSPSPPAVGQAITQLGKIGQVKVWGLALPSETRQYLESGAVNGLILWDPSKLTYLTAILVNDFLDGKQPADGAEYPGIGKITYSNGRVLMPSVRITKENVAEFDF